MSSPADSEAQADKAARPHGLVLFVLFSVVLFICPARRSLPLSSCTVSPAPLPFPLDSYQRRTMAHREQGLAALSHEDFFAPLVLFVPLVVFVVVVLFFFVLFVLLLPRPPLR